MNYLRLLIIEFFLFFKKNESLKNENTLIVNIAGIGDFLLSLKKIYSLKKDFKKIDIIVGINCSEILNVNFFNNVYFVKGDKVYNNNTEVSFLDILRNDYDEIYSYRSNFRFIAALILLKINNKIKFHPYYERLNFKNRIINYFSSEKKRNFYSKTHISQIFLNDNYQLTKEMALEIIKISQFNNFNNKPYIVLQTGGNDIIRKLTIEFINSFINNSLLPVVIIGDVREKERLTDKIIFSNNLTNLLGETRLDEIVSIVNNALLVIAPDSFLIHLSGLMKVPCLAIMGNALEETFGPDFDVLNTKVISRKPYCSPCSKNRCNKYNGLSCVQNVQPQEVIYLLEKMQFNTIS